MTGTSVLPPSQAHLVLTQSKELTPCLEASSSYTEQQECVSLIRKCKSKRELKQVHSQILKSSLFSDSLCSGSLLAACALSDWGSMDYACSIFRGVENPDTFLFNVVIRGFVRAGDWARALGIYRQMLEIGVNPDKFTYPALLKACARSSVLEEGKRIHAHSVKLGLGDDLFVQNSLVSMYGKCGGLKLARDVFDQTAQKSVASWSAIIGAHAGSGKWLECLRLFREMGREGSCRAEESAMVNVLSAITRLGALDLGMSVHASLLRNIAGLNATVETSLIDMYVNCGCLEKGLLIFQEMGKRRNKLTYSAMISGLAMHGRGKEAVEVFLEMLREGLEPDEAVYVGVLSACSHAGLVEEGLGWFKKMRIEPTIRHYACVVDLLGRAGRLGEALGLIETMPVKPNDVVWRTLLCACKVHDDIETGEIAAKHLFLSNSQNAGDFVAMSNIYARARMWDDFTRLRARMVDLGLVQIPGVSIVKVKRRVFEFVSYNVSHSDVRDMIHQMEWQLRFDGYVADTSQVSLSGLGVEGDEDEKREKLKYHNQKIAIAFALIHTAPGAAVRIVRNVRMCSDCHTYTKFISVIYEREILVRDRNRFHHFKDGSCSCRDYW